MSDSGSSSIRKKISHGYLRIYLAMSVILLFLFAAFLYIEVYVFIQSNIYDDFEDFWPNFVEEKESHEGELNSEELYIKIKQVIPDYVERYDFIRYQAYTDEKGMLVKDEHNGKHLFSKLGTGERTDYLFDEKQVDSLVYNLKEPFYLYLNYDMHTSSSEDNGITVDEVYELKLVINIKDTDYYYSFGYYAMILSAGVLILFVLGLLFILIYGAAKTKKYLKPIAEITRLTNEIQPNSPYRLNVDAAKYELKELVITINNMLDRLSFAHIKRKKFVSDVSHELRTPISVIAGYANMLKRWAKEDEEVFDESVDAIIEEAENMKYLVENLLFLARSDNDQNVYDMEPFDVSNLAESVCRDAQMVDKAKHEIVCDIEQGVVISGDRNRIKQALREFMQNSIKYTPPAGEIKMSLQKQDGKAIINIKDTGMGISKKDMGNIFTRFYRGDVSRNREKGGYGLGLSICREIISAHNGKITFSSKEGEGTDVKIELVLA